jgi:hypothetical protein
MSNPFVPPTTIAGFVGRTTVGIGNGVPGTGPTFTKSVLNVVLHWASLVGNTRTVFVSSEDATLPTPTIQDSSGVLFAAVAAPLKGQQLAQTSGAVTQATAASTVTITVTFATPASNPVVTVQEVT